MALLQTRMRAPMLDAVPVVGPAGFEAWCRGRWAEPDDALYVLKDAGANGAGGVWVFDAASWPKLLPELGAASRCVVQAYAPDPLLWRGRKFHIRVYVLLRGDMSLYLYKKAFLHVANRQFGRTDGNGLFDPQVHITNCCANKEHSGFAGEIVIDLDAEYGPTGSHLPGALENMKTVLADMAATATPFMASQRSAGHFEFIGSDFMLSNDGRAWLLENNCPPGCETATGLAEAEELHHVVAEDLISGFVLPAVGGQAGTGELGGWEMLAGPRAGFEPSESGAMNTLKWAAFQRVSKKATCKKAVSK